MSVCCFSPTESVGAHRTEKQMQHAQGSESQFLLGNLLLPNLSFFQNLRAHPSRYHLLLMMFRDDIGVLLPRHYTDLLEFLTVGQSQQWIHLILCLFFLILLWFCISVPLTLVLFVHQIWISELLQLWLFFTVIGLVLRQIVGVVVFDVCLSSSVVDLLVVNLFNYLIDDFLVVETSWHEIEDGCTHWLLVLISFKVFSLISLLHLLRLRLRMGATIGSFYLKSFRFRLWYIAMTFG
ncbi:hypothetical protein Dimus_013059 [Dionaea muscipula]